MSDPLVPSSNEQHQPITWSRVRTAVSEWSGIVGLPASVIAIIVWLFGVIPLVVFLPIIGAFGLLAILGIVGQVFVSGNQPLQTIGPILPNTAITLTKQRAELLESQEIIVASSELEAEKKLLPRALPESATSASEGRSLSLQDIELLKQHFDLKPLSPNLYSVSLDPQFTYAHDDDSVIVAGDAPLGRETFPVHFLPISNGAQKGHVARVNGVSARIAVHDFAGWSRIVHRGAWLSERETAIDFPSNCPPRKLILVTVEGSDSPCVYLVSRDFDSTYKGVKTTREELHAGLYTISVGLFAESQSNPIKTLDYILEIQYEERDETAVVLSIRHAYFWKLEHLNQFQREGYTFLRQLHEIFMDAHLKAQEAFESEMSDQSLAQFSTDVRIREKQQEEKILGETKAWEERAASFIRRHFGSGEENKFVSIKPTIDSGFERKSKTAFERLPLNLSGTDAPKEGRYQLPYWTLNDSIDRRVKKLAELTNNLRAV
jgi:hypothetical protein